MDRPLSAVLNAAGLADDDLRQITNAGDPVAALPRKRRPKVARGVSTETMVGRAINQAMGRALHAGVPFPDGEAAALIARYTGRCELTGVPFSDAEIAGCRTRPWAPTVDRIDNAKGYIAGNTRLVCWAANRARGDWPDDVFWQMVEAAYRSRHG